MQILLRRRWSEERIARKEYLLNLIFKLFCASFREGAWGGQCFLGGGTRKSEQRLKLPMFLASGKWTPHFRMLFL